MIKNYFALYHLTLELKELFEGAYIFECYSQQKNELRVTLCREKKMWSLVLTSAHPKLGLCFFDYSPRQRKQLANLFPKVNDCQILKIELSACERIITFSLESDLALSFQLYSAETNCFLLENGLIREAFKSAEKYIGKTLEERNNVPVMQNLERMALDPQFFAQQLQKVYGEEKPESLQQFLPGFDRQLQKKLLQQAQTYANESSWPVAVSEALQAMFYELIDPLPTIFYKQGEAIKFSILPEPELDFEQKQTFESINEALKQYSRHIYHQENVGSDIHELKRKLEKLLQKKHKQLREMMAGVEVDRSAEYEHLGQLILANAHYAKKGQSILQAEDFQEMPISKITIKLDPAKSVYENADVYFQKAKKNRQKQVVLKERLTQAQEELKNMEQMHFELLPLEQAKTFKTWKIKWKAPLQNYGLIAKDATKGEGLFRTFQLSDAAELWVGKNAKSNQLLTFKYAKPNDTWLHARGVSGSHCVIKARGVCTKSDIEQAAEIAAFYSAAKTSEFVPVMVTQKKFVRQKKGAPPGMVSVTKEEVMMVRPYRFSQDP